MRAEENFPQSVPLPGVERGLDYLRSPAPSPGHSKLLQLCPTVCDTLDCSPPGYSVHGILQARILEWVAIPSSKGSSQARDRTHISCICLHWQVGSLPLMPPGKPRYSLSSWLCGSLWPELVPSSPDSAEVITQEASHNPYSPSHFTPPGIPGDEF